MIGKLYFRLCQTLEKYKYNRFLNNGVDVYNQNVKSGAGHNATIIENLSFKNGPVFSIRDGLSAGYVFKEIFLDKNYSQGRMLHALRNAKIIFDIGANIGLFTYYALRNSNMGRVFCFEADPSTFQVLNTNIQQLPGELIERTTIESFAVGSSTGSVQFFSSSTSGWSSRYKTLGAKNGNLVNVQSVRLSDYLHDHNVDRVDFLKIDVEGAEFDIILGDKALLEHDIGIMVVEADLRPRDTNYNFEELLIALREKYKNVEINTKNRTQYPLIYCW